MILQLDYDSQRAPILCTRNLNFPLISVVCVCACFNLSCLHNDERSVQASFALRLYHFLTWEPHDFYLGTLKTTTKSQLLHKPNYLGLHPGFFWYLQLNSSQAFCSVVSQLLLFLADVMGEKGTRLFREFFQLTLNLFCNLHYRNHISNSSDTAHARLLLLMGSKRHSNTALLYPRVFSQNSRLEQKPQPVYIQFQILYYIIFFLYINSFVSHKNLVWLSTTTATLQMRKLKFRNVIRHG